MHKLKFIVAFLFLIVAHFPYAQGAELNRDYGKIHYCGEHAHSRQLSALVENRLHLIPAIAGQCSCGIPYGSSCACHLLPLLTRRTRRNR